MSRLRVARMAPEAQCGASATAPDFAALHPGYGGWGRRVAVLLALGFAAAALAEGRVAKPQISVDPSRGACVSPPAEMRRNHMEMLKHQRDRTLRLGERGARVSLKGCVDCHASQKTGAVAGQREDFCESCHAYAAVRLDCFECHAAKPGGKLARSNKEAPR